MSTELLRNLLIFGFLAFLLAAAVTDLRSYRIPNTVSFGLGLLFLPYAVFSGASSQAGWALLGAFVVFLAGCLCFRFKVLGGGDVKLLNAASLCAGPGLLLPFLEVTALTGGVIGLVMLLRLRFRAAAVPPATQDAGPDKLPYAVPIAAGGLWVGLQLLIRLGACGA